MADTNNCVWCRADEEGVSRQNINKQMRELSNQLQELQEDLEAEREARNKAEKLKRDLNEVSTLVSFCLIHS